MKKIGIFEIDKTMCSNCREDENCPQKYSVNGNCLHIEKGLAIEQVPTNWEELKELCKGITVGLKICKDGTIYCNEYFLARNRTPAQMWNIIKNLIGEE